MKYGWRFRGWSWDCRGPRSAATPRTRASRWWRRDESRRRRPPLRPSSSGRWRRPRASTRRPTPAPLRSPAPRSTRASSSSPPRGTAPHSAAIQSTLQYLGTPFDVLNASTGPALTADALASGTHGKYNAIFLDVGDLSVGGSSAFTDAEWTVLTTYEVEFGVRRVSLYTSPSASYGFVDNDVGVDPTTSPISATCTAAGKALFIGTNCANPVVINQGFAYPTAAARQRDDPACSSTRAETSTPPRGATPTGGRRWRSPSVRRRSTSPISSSPMAW